MKWLRSTAFLLGFVSGCALADPVTTEAQATRLALAAIHKYHLTTLADQCGTAEVSENDEYFDVDVRELHTPACGGIPETRPRLFTIRVRKRDGALSSDVYDGVSYRSVDHMLGAVGDAPRRGSK